MDSKELITPYNTTEFYALTNALSKFHLKMSDQDQEIATELRRLLPKATGSRMPAVRLDLKLNARRVSRHFVHAAACNLAAANAYRAGYSTYLNLFTGQGGGSHGRSFTVN